MGPHRSAFPSYVKEMLWKTRRWLGKANTILPTVNCLIVFYDEITWSMMEGSALDVVYHNFSKAYSADSHILVDILVRYEWAEYKLHGELADMLNSKFLVVNNSKSNWQLAACWVPQGLTFGSILFNIFINNLDERLECICTKLRENTRLEGEVEQEQEKPPYRETLAACLKMNVKSCT